MINKDAIGLDIRLDTGDVWGQLSGYFSEAQKVFSNIYMIGKEISGAIGKTFPSMEWPTKAISEDTSAIVSCLQEIELAVSDGFDQLATQSEKEGAKDAIFKGWEIAKDFYEKVPQNKKSSGGGKYLRKETDDGDGLLGIAANADMLTAGLAELTAAWDSEAIAKAASTAAQWAQTAAVTAWNGICGVASAVTTAFGAAMNFLTSPITLVVLGIAALIAIVVLLVKNWDTVKAALITGWEAVKQAFSVAGEWFNTNVIQPLVGFFTGLWDQICLIVTNVTTFISTKFQEFTLWIQTVIANVQAVFMGIDAFLLGVFATDWTNQFGAFGEVLNAFFANVENIWNAVKTIFNGIVEFVKGVFAGDWQKGCQREAVCFRKCCKGAMLPKVDDPRRRGVYLKKTKGGCLCGHEKGGIFFLIAKANI